MFREYTKKIRYLSGKRQNWGIKLEKNWTSSCQEHRKEYFYKFCFEIFVAESLTPRKCEFVIFNFAVWKILMVYETRKCNTNNKLVWYEVNFSQNSFASIEWPKTRKIVEKVIFSLLRQYLWINRSWNFSSDASIPWSKSLTHLISQKSTFFTVFSSLSVFFKNYTSLGQNRKKW